MAKGLKLTTEELHPVSLVWLYMVSHVSRSNSSALRAVTAQRLSG
jgi:hypothetical protein